MMNVGKAMMSDIWTATSIHRRGDFDHDGDVDLTDFARVQRCFTGSEQAQNEARCMIARLDEDNDVDDDDLDIFIGCATGPAVAQAPVPEAPCY